MEQNTVTRALNELKSPCSAQLSHLQLSEREGNVVCSVISFPPREDSRLLLLWTDGESGTATVLGTGAATCEVPWRGHWGLAAIPVPNFHHLHLLRAIR